jgi:hypothetical protein
MINKPKTVWDLIMLKLNPETPIKKKKGCKAYNCKNKHYAKGYCYKHYMRMYRNGKLTRKKTEYKPVEQKYCTYEG